MVSRKVDDVDSRAYLILSSSPILLMSTKRVDGTDVARNESVPPRLTGVDRIPSPSRSGSESVVIPPRLAAIDLIRVSLTWGILLFHTAGAYAPLTGYYVKSFGWSSYVLYHLSITWVVFMDVWQMPMFIFLSGVSAFHALYRRLEKQFRDERTHRLLVPWLLLASLNGVYSIAFFAPRTPFCEQYYQHGKVTDNQTLPWDYCKMEKKYTKNETFPEYLMKHYVGKPDAGQGWFLLYLFLYSQVFARIFICWHPAHTTSTTTCCPRPTYAFGKYLQGLHFFGRPAADPQEFVAAVHWWLGGTLKLGLVPALWLLISEAMDPRATVWQSFLGLATEHQLCIHLRLWLRHCSCRTEWSQICSPRRKMVLFGRWLHIQRHQVMDNQARRIT